MNMKKRFKSKKRIKRSIYKIIFVLIIIIISFIVSFKIFYNLLNIDINNEKYIKYLVNDSFGKNDLENINKMNLLLNYSFLFNVEEKKDESIKKKELLTNNEPVVYIYNTHQTEGYKTNFIDSFNIDNNVLIASFILKEYLYDLGINAIVEENKIKDILAINNWSYGYSYKASRMLLEKAKVNNPSLEYFIDIHRDSANYETTVTEIDGIKYARLLFIIGLEHENYEQNLNNVSIIESKIKDINPTLSRGILKKEGLNVNGIYNQDFSNQTFLIEVGGQYNTIDEINNTLKILAKVLYEYIKDNK